MKIMGTTLAAMMLISGFVLIGSDAGSLWLQFVVCLFGLVLMVGGGLCIININKKGEDKL
jgi:hypothetical protein